MSTVKQVSRANNRRKPLKPVSVHGSGSRTASRPRSADFLTGSGEVLSKGLGGAFTKGVDPVQIIQCTLDNLRSEIDELENTAKKCFSRLAPVAVRELDDFFDPTEEDPSKEAEGDSTIARVFEGIAVRLNFIGRGLGYAENNLDLPETPADDGDTGNDACKSIQSRDTIISFLSRCNAAERAVRERIIDLDRRLQPVLRPDNNDEDDLASEDESRKMANSEAVERNTCELAVLVEGLTHRVRRTTRHLDGIVNRLAI
jgi:hypothetical protein